MKNLKEKLGKAYYVIMDCIGLAVGFLLSYLGRIATWNRTLSMILMIAGIIVICFFGVLLVNLGKKNGQNGEGETTDEPSEDVEETDERDERDAEIERLKAELNDAHAKLEEYESSDEGDISEKESFVGEDDISDGLLDEVMNEESE